MQNQVTLIVKKCSTFQAEYLVVKRVDSLFDVWFLYKHLVANELILVSHVFSATLGWAVKLSDPGWESDVPGLLWIKMLVIKLFATQKSFLEILYVSSPAEIRSGRLFRCVLERIHFRVLVFSSSRWQDNYGRPLWTSDLVYNSTRWDLHQLFPSQA